MAGFSKAGGSDGPDDLSGMQTGLLSLALGFNRNDFAPLRGHLSMSGDTWFS